MSFSFRIIRHRVEGNDVSDKILYRGSCERLPLTGERVTFNTREGPRTYKVSRITNDLITGTFLLEVANVVDVYID